VPFLKARRQSPVNCIIELFEGKDFVILCERSHLKILPYDLNYKARQAVRGDNVASSNLDPADVW